MVLEDLDGGRIGTVNYDSHDPIGKTLQSFAVNLTNNPSFGQLLNQARGEKVEVVTEHANLGSAMITGTIVGVEQQRQPVNREAVADVEFLNVWTDKGVRSLRLADVQQVRFVNPTMESEFRSALRRAGTLARHAEKVGQPPFQRRRQTARARRLRRR